VSVVFIVIMESEIKSPLTMAVVKIKSLVEGMQWTKMMFRPSSPADYRILPRRQLTKQISVHALPLPQYLRRAG